MFLRGRAAHAAQVAISRRVHTMIGTNLHRGTARRLGGEEGRHRNTTTTGNDVGVEH